MQTEISALFRNAPERTIAAGSAVFLRGDVVTNLYLVTEGRVALQRATPSGALLILHTAETGDIVAEATAYADTCHCDAFAMTGSVLRCLARADFLRRLDQSPHLSRLWASHLAQSVQSARMRAEIRSLRTVAERLDAWLTGNRALPAHGQIQTLAADIGVTREALYRELARRRRRS